MNRIFNIKVLFSFHYLLCFFLISAMGCHSQKNKEMVFRYSELTEATNLDPALAAVNVEESLINNIYDTLYEYKYFKRPYEIKPRLADGFPQISGDGLTYNIKIKKGIFFANDSCFPGSQGREVTADDVIFSIKRHFYPETQSLYAKNWEGFILGSSQNAFKGKSISEDVPMDGLRSLDRYTLQIKLKKKSPQFLLELTYFYSAVVPKEAVISYGKEFSIHPVGSGPFKLASKNSRKIVLIKNEKYRDDYFSFDAEGFDRVKHSFLAMNNLDGRKLPMIDKVEIYIYSENIVRWRSFEKEAEIQFAGMPIELTDSILDSIQPIKVKTEYADKYF